MDNNKFNSFSPYDTPAPSQDSGFFQGSQDISDSPYAALMGQASQQSSSAV